MVCVIAPVLETFDEVQAREDIAPLVRAPNLNRAFVFFVEMVKVVGLEELIREFGEGDSLGRV